jgi:predicted secreted protein with PEFG-CTERM motif
MMNTHLSVFALSAIIIAGIGIAPAFGQVGDSVTVTTDKTSYLEGEKIMVTGKVREFFSGVPVSLTVTAPNGNVVSVAQMAVSADKNFSAELIAGGPLMRSGGTYTIEVLYGTQSRTSQTTFTFGGSSIIEDLDETKIKVSDTDFTVNYQITGGKLVSITPDTNASSLMIAIVADQDGSLTITLPRTLIDSKKIDSDEDDDFFVLIDAEEADFKETTTDTDRTLTIQFPAGAEEIEIIGTFVIPEFGTIAVMILAVAIVSIIAISAKSRLSIMPRY